MVRIATGVVDDVDSIGGEGKPLPGFYHMKVTDVQEEAGDKGEHIIMFETLCGTTAGMEGRKFRLLIANDYEKWSVRKLLAFVFATGLSTPEQQKAAEKSGVEIELDLTQAIGKQVCIELEETEYKEKKYTGLRWDNIYAVTDKRCSHVPLHAKMLEAAGIKLPEGRSVDGVSTKSKEKPAAERGKIRRETANALDDIDL